MSAAARRMLVTGRVQGVGFRWFARSEAEALGLAGWVRNLAGGGVEVFAEGEPGALDALLLRLRRGPPAARVDGVAAEEEPPLGLAGFDVRPSGR